MSITTTTSTTTQRSTRRNTLSKSIAFLDNLWINALFVALFVAVLLVIAVLVLGGLDTGCLYKGEVSGMVLALKSWVPCQKSSMSSGFLLGLRFLLSAALSERLLGWVGSISLLLLPVLEQATQRGHADRLCLPNATNGLDVAGYSLLAITELTHNGAD